MTSSATSTSVAPIPTPATAAPTTVAAPVAPIAIFVVVLRLSPFASGDLFVSLGYTCAALTRMPVLTPCVDSSL